MSKRSKAPEPFPTGPAAHRTCAKCHKRYHIYQFRYVDKLMTERSDVCLFCEGEAQVARLRDIRPS